MNIQGIDLKIRSPLPGDINFILSTMLKGVYYGSRFWNEIDKDAFFKNYEPFLKKLLLKSEVKIACLEDDEDVVLGYSIFHSNTLDFVFVKKSYRKLGIARMLCPQDITSCSHITDVGNKIRKERKIKFNPFDV